MTANVPSFFPGRVSVRVPLMTKASDVSDQGTVRVQLGAVAALNTTGILSAQSISGTSSTTTFQTTLTIAAMAPFGRNVTVVASAASTSVVTVRGRDYLNSKIQEQLTLNSATPVAGLKAFKYIDQVDWGSTSGVTINLGFGNVLGVPYKFKSLVTEVKNNIVAANAGTLVAGLATATAATATNADTRGTYLPVTVIPDGTNTFELVYNADDTNLHGNAQFFA